MVKVRKKASNRNFIVFIGESGSSNFIGGGSGIKGEKGDVGPVGPPGKTNTVYCKETRNVRMISTAVKNSTKVSLNGVLHCNPGILFSPE